ncbi:hypothetical protein MML48_5g00010390 [Holotrichia oblita]|uniref:Uncharacterized protein n=1 Tax=Holotrichia oblita TaxID=644536 RepID=A0ACB9T4G2_HOLOL|nr:hypothetical protein MML48_5g00010390 [Holotrichia oblita]
MLIVLRDAYREEYEAANADIINSNYLIVSGRLLARQYLVPLLLGLKFNVASIFPILFGALALLISKAAIISKLAFVISTAYALSGVVFTNHESSCHQNYYQPTLNPAFGGHYDLRYKNEDYADSYLKGKNLFGDQIRLRGSIPVDEVFTREAKQVQTGRNFAWSDDDEKKT